MVRVRARSYCSSANLGSGFDVVAVALDAYYDEVEVEVVRGGSGSVVLESVGGVFAELVDRDINTSVAAAKELLKFVGVDNVDVSIRLWKGIPPSAGLGGSGASAVATIKAVMTALDLELSHNEIIEIAGRAEAVVAGEPHYDNVSASLLGGLVFVLSSNPV
ncbi:MAG: homoserine kinase, partial [Sulfolobales archaeon]